MRYTWNMTRPLKNKEAAKLNDASASVSGQVFTSNTVKLAQLVPLLINLWWILQQEKPNM